MNQKLLHTLVLYASSALATFAQGTVFTYQGRLNANGVVANGSYDLRFILYNADFGGSQIGPIVTNAPVAVSGGLFAVTLDFGMSVFTGPPRWLEIGVRTNGSASQHTPLSLRQPVTPTPYAITAGNVVAGGGLSGAYSNAVSFNNAASSFSGSGAGLTSVNAATLGGLGAGAFWQLGGNAGTTPGVDFIGTTDNQPLEFKANGVRVLRLEPKGAPNVIGGSPVNFVAAGMVGATIGGGGGNYLISSYTNRVTASFGTVGGGAGNASSGDGATVGGGVGNTSSGGYATVGGGLGNTISSAAFYATICGGANNSVGGAYSLAAGRNCNVPNSGSFMWSDGTLPLTSFTDNGFFALATGGFYFYTGNSMGVQVAAGGNAWSAISDRNVKENFVPVDTRAVLEKVVAMPVTTWNLKTQSPEIRHIGAMAQDFKAAFAVGEDDRHISTSDADGVALAAIQGLNQKLADELKQKETQITELKQRLENLERLVNERHRDTK